MTAWPAAYRLAQRKALLRQMQNALHSTLSEDLPLDDRLLAQFKTLNEIFLRNISAATLTRGDLAGLRLALRAQRQGVKALEKIGKSCRHPEFSRNELMDRP